MFDSPIQINHTIERSSFFALNVNNDRSDENNKNNQPFSPLFGSREIPMGVWVSFLEYGTNFFTCLTLSLRWPASWLRPQLIYQQDAGSTTEE